MTRVDGKAVTTEMGHWLVYVKEGRVIGVFTFEERGNRIFLTGTCYRGDVDFPVTRRTCRSLFRGVSGGG